MIDLGIIFVLLIFIALLRQKIILVIRIVTSFISYLIKSRVLSAKMIKKGIYEISFYINGNLHKLYIKKKISSVYSFVKIDEEKNTIDATERIKPYILGYSTEIYEPSIEEVLRNCGYNPTLIKSETIDGLQYIDPTTDIRNLVEL